MTGWEIIKHLYCPEAVFPVELRRLEAEGSDQDGAAATSVGLFLGRFQQHFPDAGAPGGSVYPELGYFAYSCPGPAGNSRDNFVVLSSHDPGEKPAISGIQFC